MFRSQPQALKEAQSDRNPTHCLLRLGRRGRGHAPPQGGGGPHRAGQNPNQAGEIPAPQVPAMACGQPPTC